ncbi:MAG TPA: hypothetical protein VG426_10965, partial [Candidatus Dormibacteraeota bacterium]|nr:hypothetical protein [Candidatus Dormibacteraeota bacterium]
MQENEPWAAAAPATRRIRRKRRIATRAWVALAALVAVALTAGGGVLAFENAMPTSLSLNIKNGDKDVSTYSR